MSRTRLYYHTLRHLRPWQVFGRVAAQLRRRMGPVRLPPAPAALQRRLRLALPFPQHDPWNTRSALLDGSFRFLDRAERLGWPPDWNAGQAPLLWRFNLHYFHYLHLLGADEQAALCRSWIAANPAGRGVGWHPYPASLRLVNWCRAAPEAPDVLASLYQQAAFLYRNLETYVYGNHLMENARALVVAGCFFEGQGEAPAWLARGLALYRQETAEQILPDGGHYERSPMYHALMLEGYLDVLNVLPADHPDRPWLLETARKMGDVLVSFTHPDGHLALFNDATHEIALPPSDLLAYLRGLTGYDPRPAASLPHTGYYAHRDDDLYVLIDGGAVGPDHLLAHAHADVFSFELSAGGLPFVVDTGVYEYPEGAMRDYVRSTRAHNTVCIDGMDQVECWGSFRVARRAAPHDVSFRRDGAGSRFEGTFDGYAALLGDDLSHRRCVAVDPARRVVTVQDDVAGRGVHQVESRLHLHPGVRVERAGEGLLLHRDGRTCRLEATGGALAWEPSWYCPRFGVRQQNTVVVLGGSVPLPARLAYRLHY